MRSTSVAGPTGAYRAETIVTLRVSETPAETEKRAATSPALGRIYGLRITTSPIALPKLYEDVWQRIACLVSNISLDENSVARRNA